MTPIDEPHIRRRNRKRKACVQCTKSKRKCDQSFPRCKRCLEKGEKCDYQPFAHLHSRSRDGEVNAEDQNQIPSPLSSSHIHTSTTPDSHLPDTPSGFTLSTDPDAPPQLRDFGALPSDRWFLSPESWDRKFTPPEDQDPMDAPAGEETLPYYISKIQSWASSWITTGHSPIHHRALYRAYMPECVQDAFTSYATYLSATPATKPTILQIIRDRADRLVSSYSTTLDCSLDMDVTVDFDNRPTQVPVPCIILDTATHLARTQALFIYQLVCLFDGDIRSRAKGEEHMDTLHAWAGQVFESARLDCSTAELWRTSEDADAEVEAAMGGGPSPGPGRGGLSGELVRGLTRVSTRSKGCLWRAWILAESVRRTFLVAEYMQSVYLTMKRGWSVCPGGVSFTARSGLWDANSGWAWAAEVRESGPLVEGQEEVEERKRLLLLQSMDAWTVMKSRRPRDVDEFTHLVLEISYGKEAVEQWFAEKR